MKPGFRIILALSFSLAACGHSKPDLFLDQTTTALECSSDNASDCVASDDAGTPRPEVDECYGDGDCEYGAVCDRRHGVSQCQPVDEHGHDGEAGHGGDDSSSDDDSHDGHDSSSDDDDGHDDRPDGGAAGCDPASRADDQPEGSDDCSGDDGEDREDRSGSNSGRH